jgi:tetratricopeptide (TPR) repeat protein/CHAT domain-containing protein
MSSNFSSEDIFEALDQWLSIVHPIQSRHFLEQHRELLAPVSGELMERLLRDFHARPALARQLFGLEEDVPREAIQDLINRLQLLRAIHRRGCTEQAISDAYFDLYGGAALNLPTRLQMAMFSLMGIAMMGESEQTALQGSRMLREIIAQVEDDPDVPPEMLAELRFLREDTLRQTAAAETLAVQQERLACLQAVFPIYTRDRYPRHYADLQHHLALLYKFRKEGDPADNLNKSIACFKRSLEVYAVEDYPEDHAMNRYNLGDVLMAAYIQQNGREQSHLITEAIACFEDALTYYTRSDFPQQYANILQHLGGVYSSYKGGQPGANIARAYQYFEQALEIFTPEEYPAKYAEVHYLLALLYKERSEYERPEALEEALQSCKNALRIYTLEAWPHNYAAIQNLMGSLYMQRFIGKRADNIEEAIACHNHAVQIYTLEYDPIEHAETQNLLGNAYRERIAGARQENQERALTYYHRALEVFSQQHHEQGVAKMYYNLAGIYSDWLGGKQIENIETAIHYCRQALEIYTRERFPENYAETIALLGSLYRKRLNGEIRSNIEEAIICFQQALAILTLVHSPKRHAEIEHNLGNAYAERLQGSRPDNLEEAIKCYIRALQVFTVTDFPLQYARTSTQLGTVYSERVLEDRRANQEKAIRCFEQALQILSYEGTPLDYAAAHHNLANVYGERISGTQQENQEQAIYHYNEALKVEQPDTHPYGYAQIQDALGAVYSQRIAGDRRGNLEQALLYHSHALQIFTREAFPLDYARTLHNLGATYTRRLEGEPQANLKQAIACFKTALEIMTPENAPNEYVNAHSNLGSTYLTLVTEEQRYRIELAIEHFDDALRIMTLQNNPVTYAAIQGNLGYAYTERVMGKRWENIEKAIACYTEALKVFTLESSPQDYGKVQNNLGAAYMERLTGDRQENIEQAIKCFDDALNAYKNDPISRNYANTLMNLGTAYISRGGGDRRENLEKALTYQQQALFLCSPEAFPQEYASAQFHLGNAYALRIEGDRQTNLQAAIACYQQALAIFTPDAFPQQHCDVQLNLAMIEVSQQHWQEAHMAYVAAMKDEEQLFKLGKGIVGKDVVLKKGKDASLNNGYVLTRLGQVAKAAVSIEYGRARELAEALELNNLDPQWIHDPQLRARYEQARESFIGMQAILNTMASRHFDIDRMLPNQWPGIKEQHNRRMDIIVTEALQERQRVFEEVLKEVLDEIDQAQSDFPLPFVAHASEQTLLLAADACGVGHAIVYLTPIAWGSIAVAVLSRDLVHEEKDRFIFLDLPELTREVIDDLLEMHLDRKDQPISNSFVAAQAQQGLSILLHDWQGETFRECAMALRQICESCSEASTFDQAAWQTLQSLWVAEIVDQPFVQMQAPSFELLARTMAHFLMHYEIRRCLEILARVAVRPLATWLQQQGVSSCTLIACGELATFPLHAAEVMPGKTLADLFMVSVAPNARSLFRTQKLTTEPLENNVQKKREGVYSLGNPLPTYHNLAWGAAEALTLAKLARLQKLSTKATTGKNATREWLIEALENGYVVDASCHGHFDISSPLDSSLKLARQSYIPLYELLSHQIEMRGLRLLILSACQTAVVDLRGTVNEVHSLAVGMVQAGARAVLAALWPVDEIATYLLIVRFAQEWFPRMNEEPPSAALARAQRWLRTVTAEELRNWRVRQELATNLLQYDEAEVQEPARRNEFEDFFVHFDSGRRSEVSYDINGAAERIRVLTNGRSDRAARPFANEIYWAGFQILGW